MSANLEEVELNITPNEILVKKYFAGYNEHNYAISSLTIITTLPIINVKAEDKFGKLNTEVKKASDTQTEIQILFRKPIPSKGKYSYKLTQLIDDSIVEQIGSTKILNWPNENITRIWIENQELFFVSVLAQIKQHDNSVEIIPISGARNLISHTRNSSAIRIEYGYSSKYRLEFDYSITNETANPCTEVEVDLTLPATTKYQKVKLINVPEGSNVEKDRDGNTRLKFTIDRLEGHEKIASAIKLEVSLEKQFINYETKLGNYSNYQTITKEGSLGFDLIQGSKYWSINNPKIIELVKAAIQGYQETEDVVRILFEFVNQKIDYERNNTRETADKTLENRIGDCSEMSDLFVTLLRRARIPSRVIHGWIYDPETNELDGHAWVEYFTPNLGWIQCDPTWGVFAGVSCQQICRKIEGVEIELSDSSVKYKYDLSVRLQIDEAKKVLSVN
ncbi:MAG: transglutaminase domain-containing protein [Asgard group archaeon]|nr:transglutaminase domain-containing protein [Asgard group archaeon]